MKKFDSAYYGLIPTPVRYHKELKPTHKLLYAEITACLDHNGVCTRSNNYFSKVLNMSKGTVSNYMNMLRKEGFINVTIENEEGTMRFLNRYITLTPTSHNVGVNSNDSDTHTPGNVGVGDNYPLEDVKTSTSTNGTLLHSNNNINTVYKKQQALDTPLNKNINDKQRDALYKIVHNFYTVQKSTYPDMIRNEDINGSINVLYDLIRIDGYQYESVRDSIKWATEDPFWGSNLFSLKTLRNKSSNGLSKFQNLNHKYKSK